MGENRSCDLCPRDIQFRDTPCPTGQTQHLTTMPASPLTHDEVEQIKIAVESGLTIKEAADKFGVDYEALRKRSQREKWVTIQRMDDEVQKAREKLRMSRMSQTPSASTVVIETIAERGEKFRSLALAVAQRGMERAKVANLDVESWDDVKKITEIGAKAAGLDKGEGASVTVLFGAPPAETTFQEPDEAQEAEIIDADVIDADE